MSNSTMPSYPKYQIVKTFDHPIVSSDLRYIRGKVFQGDHRVYLQTPTAMIRTISDQMIFLTCEDQTFLEYLRNLDRIALTSLTENLLVSLRQFNPSIVGSPFNTREFGLVLDLAGAEIYNQERNDVQIESLRDGYTARAIILLDRLEDHRIVWTLKQLKVHIPAPILDQCVLSDNEVDEEV